MSLRYVGSVAVTEHFNPSFSWTSEADAAGIRGASVDGEMPWSKAQQLSELVGNRHTRVQVGDRVGVLDYLHPDDDLLAPFRGWYLLRSFALSGDQPSSLNGISGPVGFSLSADFLGANFVEVVARSARNRGNVHGITPIPTIADPFGQGLFVVAPAGAASFTREYDTAVHGGTAVAGSMVIYSAAMVAGLDVLPPVALPTPVSGTAWLSARGGDVRAYDRRAAREVFGPAHPFQATTDIVLTNGLIRAWVGPRGAVPYLNVQAFASGAWSEVGCQALTVNDADVLLGARLVRVTPDASSMVLSCKRIGEVTVTLKRGARGFDIHHGSARPPTAIEQRGVKWLGMPPTKAVSGTSNGTGKFGNGLSTTGYVQWQWPTSQPKTSWSFAGWWKPTASQATQGDSGLLGLTDTTGLVGGVTYTTADDKINFSLGASTVSSPALTFAASGPVFWSVSFDTINGMALTVSTATQPAMHAVSAAVDSGTAQTVYDSFTVGAVGAPFGSTTFGGGTYGGILVTSGLNGVADNLMLFDAALTATERASLSTAATALANLPAPASRLIWYAPFDAKPVPLGSLLGTGRRYEATAENGATRLADSAGFTKAVASLVTATTASPFGLQATAKSVDLYAYLARVATSDDLADHHAQFCAATEQEVLAR